MNMITKDGKSWLLLEWLAVELLAVEQQSICRCAAARRQMNAFNFARQMAIFNYDLFRFSMRANATLEVVQINSTCMPRYLEQIMAFKQSKQFSIARS